MKAGRLQCEHSPCVFFFRQPFCRLRAKYYERDDLPRAAVWLKQIVKALSALFILIGKTIGRRAFCFRRQEDCRRFSIKRHLRKSKGKLMRFKLRHLCQTQSFSNISQSQLDNWNIKGIQAITMKRLENFVVLSTKQPPHHYFQFVSTSKPQANVVGNLSKFQKSFSSRFNHKVVLVLN